MFNFFSSSPSPVEQALPKALSDIESRWYTFLNKLEEKYNEVIAAIETEAPQVYLEDQDQFKMAYHRFKSGMEGQLTHIARKAYDTHEQQILDTYYAYDKGVLDPLHNAVFSWRERCQEFYRAWEERLHLKREYAFRAVETQANADLETRYQFVLQEYEHIKHLFTCKQCSSPLSIDKIFFISTYITCPSCRTQNTFEPSTQAKQLQHMARPLAEHRARHLYREYEQHIYQGNWHDKAALKAGKQDELEYYEKYLRAMFNEMNNILPDMLVQNEQFYARLLDDFKTHISNQINN